MDKTIGKWLSLLLLMFCAGNAAFAQKLTAEDFSIKAGESKNITIVYEGTEAMHGFQTDITLSEGLSCDDYPMGIALSFLNNSNKLGTNGYRVAGYNEEGGTASNGDGIIALTVKASDDFTGGTIKLTHTEISFEGDNAVNPEDLTINVTVEKEPVVEGDKYALFTGDIEPGDYIIYYDGKAMNSTIATNRLQYEEVTPVDNAIVNPSADIVWTIAKDGDNYTIYNAANKGYAASNGTKNQAAFATEVSDNARWTVSGTETYEFVNVANSAAGVNANLRNNGTYGFACYSTGTGGALTLYKKVEAGEVVKPVLTESQNFDSPLTIEITAEDGADIYYTTDGSTPTESSTKYTEPFRVVWTTTVNAIAVKGGVTSEVATATYTRVNPILISEAQALDAGSEAYIVGACVASAANGAVLYDGSDYIYYYNNANDLEVGKYYSVNGILSSYGGANQFTAAADVKEHAPADLVIPTDVTELTATDLDAAVEAKKVDPRQLASLTGTLTISGNYLNITVDGTETSMGSIVKPFEDYSALDGKNVTVTGYEMYVNNKYVYFVATNIEEAPGEVISGQNWTFDENPDDVITVTTQGYQRNIPEGSDQITGLQPVTGWTPGEQDQSDPGFSAGIFKYGSENLLNNKVAAPSAAPEGSESPSALGLSAVWGGIAQYTQPITLQPGSYKYVYVLYNGANTGAVTKNLFGFIAEDGTEYLSDKTTFPVGEWDGGEVSFTLEEETTGKLSVGFIGGGGSGNAPHLFVDFIDLEKIDEADVAKDELEKAIEAAQAKEYVIGDELFQYPQSEIDPLDEAIAAAQAVYDNEDATVDEVNAATETLNNFIETFDPAYNEPEDGTPYIMTLTTSDGQFPLAIDGTANKIVEEGEETYIYFDKQEDGTWGMKTEDGDYIAYEGSNKWTMSTSTEPYGWTIEALKDGGVSVSGTNGLYGTNTSDGNAAGSAIYGDKTTANGNYIWNIEPAEQEPEGTLYNGTLTQTLAMPNGTVMGEEVDIDYDVFISAPDPNNGVQIQFVDGFTFPVMGTVVPDLIVDAQMTTNEDGSISYSSEPFTVSVPRGMMTVTFNATLTGTQENEKVNPVITLTLSQGTTTNTVVFGPREEGVFAVNIDEAIENGTVESDKATAKEGETVTLTVTPDEGFELDVLSVTYPETTMEADGTESTEMKEVEVTETADGYTFTMPAADAFVSAIFKATEPGLPDYVFVATEWQAGDPARISADNVTVDETANTITVNKDGNQNVNLQFKGIDYNVPAENKYFVVQATGCTPDGAQLWWMNNDWIGTITPEVYTVGDEILYAWPLEVLKKNGGSGEPITLASDTDDALFNYNSQWSTCFGLTLADPNTPAVITNIGFTSQLPEIAVGINRIGIDGADFAATIDNALRNGKVFDISGRKINSVVKGGIYIVDGVKMVVRK